MMKRLVTSHVSFLLVRFLMGLQELHQIEAELHEEILPGTEIMTDVGSHHFVKGGSHVLVPQP